MSFTYCWSKPFVGKPGADLIVIITTIAGASFLQNGVQVIFGPRYKQLDRILKGPPLEVLDTAIGLQEVLIIVLTPVTLIAAQLVFEALQTRPRHSRCRPKR